MAKDGSFLHCRNLWVYYVLFFSGSVVLVYQSYNWDFVGDSVNFLCLLFLVNGFLAKKPLHILENSFLMTLGYILPLLIRNSLKLSYTEAPSMLHFLKLGAISTGTTFALGCAFTCIGFLIAQMSLRAMQMSRSKITTNVYHED
ncbi:hypothetical protein QJS83_00225 [Bdellovibrio sp. 22V]|uniref:hypothetical protein n=1 Tax=Bdellovibrio TaxID=958 RepID=UPI0025436D87|nr:hypothetical protein [Bdellovibrio sp. 22V]WII72291.1 hypothetical protein QJS83_00225 [Bdellovibrio sp. 22V]